MAIFTVFVDLTGEYRANVAALDCDPRFAALVASLFRLRAGPATLGNGFRATDEARAHEVSVRFACATRDEKELAVLAVRSLVRQCWRDVEAGRPRDGGATTNEVPRDEVPRARH